MKPENFEVYTKVLKEKSGIIVTPDKSYLLESRLNPLAKEFGHDSIDAMAPALSSNPDLLSAVIEAMTTNETSFFRDQRPFDLFKEYLLPSIQKQRAIQKKLKIWCAAASSGQEPYSLSMILNDLKSSSFSGWTSDILGTDISNDILDKAKKGCYSQFEVQRGLPIQMLMSYFTQNDTKWQINDDIRNMVRYETFNLLDDMAKFGKFDIIFCRNVLIYFDEETKTDILERLRKQLSDDGFLILGGAETVLNITKEFVPVPGRRGAYVVQNSLHLETPVTNVA